jgi:hypothetical protein
VSNRDISGKIFLEISLAEPKFARIKSTELSHKETLSNTSSTLYDAVWATFLFALSIIEGDISIHIEFLNPILAINSVMSPFAQPRSRNNHLESIHRANSWIRPLSNCLVSLVELKSSPY